MYKCFITLSLLLITSTALAGERVSRHIDELFKLADVMYCEARGEGYGGMLAVADVITNRLETGKWGDCIIAIIEQPWQFECIHKSTAIDRESPEYWLAVQIAADHLAGNTVKMTIATHYINKKKLKRVPDWVNKLEYLGDIGSHSFYLD